MIVLRRLRTTGLATLVALSMAGLSPAAAADAEALRAEAFTLVSGSAADKAKAITLFEEAAAAGDAASMAFLGGLYLSGDGVPVDRAKAVEWYLKAAQAGHPAAAAKLAELAAAPVPQPTPEPATAPAAASESSAAAALIKAGKTDEAVRLYGESDDAASLFAIGEMYYNGDVVDEDRPRALSYFQRAADLGSTEGMESLSTIYFYGIGVDEDREKARALSQAAADAGSGGGFGGLGRYYDDAGDTAKAIEAYQKAVDLGDVTAMLALGSKYEYGDGMPAQPAMAARLYRRGADTGEPYTTAALAALYEAGRGVEEDMAEAERLYLAAAAPGNIASHLRGVAEFYVRQDRAAESIPWYEKATEAGDYISPYQLGTRYQYGIDVEEDLDKAFDYFTLAAERSNGEAMQALGYLYIAGYGGDPDWEKSKDWFRKSAEDGHGPGMESYAGALLADGDLAGARAWYEAAGEAGVTSALVALGGTYLTADEPDEREALEIYQRAAERGDADAMVAAAGLYGGGIDGGAPQPEERLQWLRRAVAAGSSEGMNLLGVAYVEGKLVEQDLDQAFALFTKAAESFDAGGMYNLCVSYLNGWGTAPDPVKAAEWCEEGADISPAATWQYSVFLYNGTGTAADPVAAAEYGYRALRYGSKAAADGLLAVKGLDVAFRKRLQELLLADGFYAGTVDGAFGPASMAALKAAAPGG